MRKLSNMGARRKIDRHTTESENKGFVGLFEIFIRRFRTFSFSIILIPIIGLCLGLISLALVPMVALTTLALQYFSDSSLFVHSLAIASSLALGFFLYGMSIIFLVPLANFLLPLKLKAWKGNWRSIQTLPWYVHNALVYIVRYTFLDFITPSPIVNLFYRMMGMKIGKGVIINSTNISDPCLITIEDYATIGGSVHLLAHYGQKGVLVLAPVLIKRGANIGLKASIMGGVVVGENATVKPHAVLLPRAKVPDNSVVG